MSHILVVEDDPMIREMLVRRLKWEGFEVMTATNGAQAVALTRTGHIDLVLMDMGLPILNGWQATERIRANPETASLPIIALTAYALSDDRVRCLDVGCNAFASKPIDFVRLIATMHQLLSGTINVQAPA